MVDKVTDARRSNKSGAQATTTIDQLKQRAAEKAHAAFKKTQATDSVSMGAVTSANANSDVVLPPGAAGAVIPPEALKPFAALGALLLDAPPEGVRASERFELTLPKGLQPAATFELGTEATEQMVSVLQAFDELSASDPTFAKSEKGEVLKAYVRVCNSQLDKLSGADAAMQKLATDPSPTAEAARQLQTHFAPLADALRTYLKTGVPPKDDNGKALADLLKEGETPPAEEEAKLAQPKGDATQVAQRMKGPTEPPGKVWKIDSFKGGGGASLSQMLEDPALDIESCVQLLFMQLAKDAETDLRDVMKEMASVNARKLTERAISQSYREAGQQLEEQMRTELNQLQNDGVIGKSTTFDDYKGWRQVVVSEPMLDPTTGEAMKDGAGNPIMQPPSLADPSPPIEGPPKQRTAMKSDKSVVTKMDPKVTSKQTMTKQAVELTLVPDLMALLNPPPKTQNDEPGLPSVQQSVPSGQGGRMMTLAGLTTLEQKSKDQMDSLSELGQSTSLRLQMYMDRRAKFIETLSNTMKKLSQTNELIIGNTK